VKLASQRYRVARALAGGAGCASNDRSDSGADLTFAPARPRVRKANVKSKTPLESYICQWSFDSNIRKSGRWDGMRMLQLDHWRRPGAAWTGRPSAITALIATRKRIGCCWRRSFRGRPPSQRLRDLSRLSGRGGRRRSCLIAPVGGCLVLPRAGLSAKESASETYHGRAEVESGGMTFTC
jgi:hypothetical protein